MDLGGPTRTRTRNRHLMRAVPRVARQSRVDNAKHPLRRVSIERTARLAWHVHAKFTKVLPDGRDARVDHDRALGLLRAVGYAGCVSVEYEGDEPGTTAVPRALAYLHYCDTGSTCFLRAHRRGFSGEPPPRYWGGGDEGIRTSDPL